MISVRRSRAEEVEIYEIVWKITTSRSKDMAINPAFISPCGLSRIDEDSELKSGFGTKRLAMYVQNAATRFFGAR